MSEASNMLNLYDLQVPDCTIKTGSIPLGFPPGPVPADVLANAAKNSVTVSAAGVPILWTPPDGQAGDTQDWYLCSLSFSLANAPGAVENSDERRGAYLRDAVLRIAPDPAFLAADGSGPLQLYPQVAPQTYVGGASSTSTVGGNFGGSVGFFGDEPTGSISGGMNFSNSVTVSQPDLEISEQSALQVPQWMISARAPERGQSPTVFDKLGAMSPVSCETLEFQALWAWSMPTKARPPGATAFAFTISLVCAYQRMWVDGTGAKTADVTCAPVVLKGSLAFPQPSGNGVVPLNG